MALILTCKHVISGPVERLTVTFRDGRQAYARFYAADEYADLAAIVITADEGTPVIPIADEEPAVGTTVCQVGYPGGRGPTGHRGRYLGVKGRTTNGIACVEASFESRPGDSGSGFIDEANRKLVAVLWGGNNQGGPPAVATGLRDVWRFTEKHCSLFCPGRRRPPCPPGYPPAQPPVPSVPIPPASPPAQPPAQPPADAGLIARIERIEALLVKIEGMQGKPGPQGPVGPQGPPGPAGPQGPACDKAEVEELRKEVARLKLVMSKLSGSIRVKVEPISKPR